MNQTLADFVRTAVSKGAAVLDEQEPGWFHKVDPDTIRQSSTTYCVLGQTFGSYYTALNTLTISEGTVAHGFAADEHLPSGSNRSTVYVALSKEWARVVRERKGGVVPSQSTTTDEGDLLTMFKTAGVSGGSAVSLFLALTNRDEKDRALVAAALA